jgi:ribosome biogenesis GTPase
MQKILALLRHCVTLVLGPSGSGKSSFINVLDPSATQATREISQALQSGKHTTSATTLHWLEFEDAAAKSTAIIDSPGFQEFGLHHVETTELATLMPDLRVHLGGCKFYNCQHIHEPSCSLRDQVGYSIHPKRYDTYQRIWSELNQTTHYS